MPSSSTTSPHSLQTVSPCSSSASSAPLHSGHVRSPSDTGVSVVSGACSSVSYVRVVISLMMMGRMRVGEKILRPTRLLTTGKADKYLNLLQGSGTSVTVLHRTNTLDIPLQKQTVAVSPPRSFPAVTTIIHRNPTRLDARGSIKYYRCVWVHWIQLKTLNYATADDLSSSTDRWSCTRTSISSYHTTGRLDRPASSSRTTPSRSSS